MCRNEEKIIPYFIQHYAGMVDEIILIDNQSTDNTAQIAKDMCKSLNQKLIYKELPSEGFSDLMKLQLFRSIQKNILKTDSDWYILVDSDEFIYHKSGKIKDSIEVSHLKGFMFIKPTGYQMSESSFPAYSGKKITDTCKMGCKDKGFDKPVIVHKDLDWAPRLGCHLAEGYYKGEERKPDDDSGLLLLHYKFLGFEHRLERVRHCLNRLDAQGKTLLANGIGGHLSASEEILKEEFDGIFAKREQII